MKVIITGANGFIGSAVVKKFYENGADVVAVIKDENERIDHIKNYARIIYSDLSDPSELADKIDDGKDSVFYHFAWAGVNGKAKIDYNVQIDNIRMVCNCVTAAHEVGCKRFLAAGTVAENAIKSFGDLSSLPLGLLYAVAKNSARNFAENLCKNFGLPFVWMQFSNVYGPKNKTGNLVSYTLSMLKSGQPAEFGPADQPYDFIYVDDLIEAVYRLGMTENPSRTNYFIGSGKPRILKDYLFEIGKKVGCEDLIKIGMRTPDGIRYNNEMFDTSALTDEIGDYVSAPFDEAIEYTIRHYDDKE